MIGDHDILSFNYLKKQDFTGSYQGMRYLLRKAEAEEQGAAQLEAVIWPEPFNLEHTDEASAEKKTFDFSEDGRTKAIEWLRERYESGKEYWEAAKGRL